MFISFGAVLSLFVPYLKYLYFAILALYITIDFIVSFKSTYIDTKIGHFRLVWVHFILHFSYGLGFFVGLFKFGFKKW